MTLHTSMNYWLAALAITASLTLAGCSKKTSSKAKDAVKDTGEAIKSAAKDTGNAVKSAGEATKDATGEAIKK